MKSRWSCLCFLALLTWVWLVSLGYSEHGYAETCPTFQAFLRATADLDISTQETNLRRHIDALAKTGGTIQLVTTSRNKPAIHLPQSGRFTAKDIPLHRFRHLKSHLALLFASHTPDPFTPRFSIDRAALEARMDEIFRLSLANTDEGMLYHFGSFHEHVAVFLMALEIRSKNQPARAMTPRDTHFDDDLEHSGYLLEEDLLGLFETMRGDLPYALDQGAFAFNPRARWVQWLLLNPVVFQQSSFELLTFYVLNFGAYLTEADKAFLSTIVVTTLENSRRQATQAKHEDDSGSGIWENRIEFLQTYPSQKSQHYTVWYEILSRGHALNRIQEAYGVTPPPTIEHASFPSLMKNALGTNIDDITDGKFSDVARGIQVNGLKNIFAPHTGKALKDVPLFTLGEVTHRTTDLGAATLIAQGESVVSLGQQSVFGGSAVWGEGVYMSFAADLYQYGPFVITFRLNPDAIIGKDIDIFRGQQDGYIVVAKNNTAFLPTETHFDAKKFPKRSEPGWNHIQWISQVADQLTPDEKQAYVRHVIDAVQRRRQINPHALFVIVETCRAAINADLQAEVDRAFAYQQVHYQDFPPDFYPDIFERFDNLEDRQSLDRDELTRKFFKNEAVLTLIHHAPDVLTRHLGPQGMVAIKKIAGIQTPEDLILAMKSFDSATKKMAEPETENLPDLIRTNYERHLKRALAEMKHSLEWLSTQDLDAIHPARLLAFYDEVFTRMTAVETHPFRKDLQSLLLRIGAVLLPLQKAFETESALPTPLGTLHPQHKESIQKILLKYDFETATLRPSRG